MADEGLRDERAEQRERRVRAKRERMRKHGARTAAVYRDAVLKELRKRAGRERRAR